MPKPTTQQQLLDEAEKEYGALQRQVASFTRDEMVRPGVIGDWSIKDILAHLLEWQRMLMSWYEIGLRGEKPAVPGEGYKWSQLPALNQAIYERYRDMALDDARNQLEASHKRMLELARSLSEEELFMPGHCAWTGTVPLASYINSCAGAHYRWARTGIRRGTRAWSAAALPATRPGIPTKAAGKRTRGGKASAVTPGTALLVIDVQEELFEKSTPIYQEDQLLSNINVLVDRAHAAGVPVFFVQQSGWKTLVEGSDGWRLHSALKPLSTDHFIRKHHGNAFQETTLKDDLDALHVRRIVVAGLLTHNCVRLTCNGAHDLAYDVVLASDAHSNYSVKARDDIDEWNATLSHGVVRLLATADVRFESKQNTVARPLHAMHRTTSIAAGMIAPCGMNCGICSAYLRPKNRCSGCLALEGPKQKYCTVCSIKTCAERSKGDTFCFDCAKYPCAHLKHLDKRYRTRYGMSMIENQNRIRDLGLDGFMAVENTRWVCPSCGSPICIHTRLCYTCGAQYERLGSVIAK
jgi:nicotinamidase-related amidase